MKEKHSAEVVRPGAELNAAREQLAATQEILSVISNSRSDETPVFEAILSNAARLCQAPMAWLLLVDDSQAELSLAAYHGLTRRALNIGQTWPLNLVDELSGLGLAITRAKTFQDDDLSLSPGYLAGDVGMVQLVDEEGLRTRISVPLIREGKCIGAIVLSRREVKPFSDDEIRLVDTFAGQAVIAIENVRQFREVQTRLEREAASAEILRALSENRSDDEPVFEAILSNAAGLCGARLVTLTLVNEARTHLSYVTHWGTPLTIFQPGVTEWPINSPTAMCEAIRKADIVHVADLVDSDLYRAGDKTRVRVVDEEGVRAMQAVPLIQGGQAIGAIGLHWSKPKAFNESETALIRTFAEQAVIAIENVRQFREVQTRLAREQATREILQVISASRADHQAVFETLLARAVELLESDHGSVWLLSDDGIHIEAVARHEDGAELGADFDRRRMDEPDSIVAEVVRTCSVWQADDLPGLQAFSDAGHRNRTWIEQSHARSILLVPLELDGRGIGLIAVYRRRVQPFSNDHASVLRSFAAQAVIAIENVRQFKALEALNAELGIRVEEQVGEIERMGKLKRFLPAAVADTVVSSGSEKMLKSHRALLGVLFCDIRGFTAFCETAEPEETIEVLQTYHEEMGKLINAHGAGVDHRMGDGIMVLFNDPLPCEDPAGDAVRLAVAMRAKMSDLSQQWKRFGHKLGFGVGVSLGYATVGMVGYEDRSDYTASGTAINVGARLCEMAEDGEILLSTRAAIAVEDDFPSVSAGEVTLKGIREPVEVFRILDGTEG